LGSSARWTLFGFPGKTATAFMRLLPRGGQCGLALLWDVVFAALLQRLGDQSGPARLVTCPDATAVVAMEIFVEQNEIAPVGVVLELVGLPVDRAATGGVAQEDRVQPAREFRCNLAQGHPLARTSRKLDLEGISVVIVEALQR